MQSAWTVTYIGGPTILVEFGGLRLLTDPTFDAGGGDYPTGPVTLRKLSGPVVSPESLVPIDFVLLSHDHHADNLDRSGREFLKSAKKVFTTEEGAERLGGNAAGLKDWQTVDVTAPEGGSLRITATPARHGPVGMDHGPVCGFVLALSETPESAIYISGDTVWYEGVEEVAKRFPVRAAILHLGAARVPEAGNFHLTMTADEGVEAARAFSEAEIIPVHFEGWAHFSEGKEDILRAFANAGLDSRLRWA